MEFWTPRFGSALTFGSIGLSLFSMPSLAGVQANPNIVTSSSPSLTDQGRDQLSPSALYALRVINDLLESRGFRGNNAIFKPPTDKDGKPIAVDRILREEATVTRSKRPDGGTLLTLTYGFAPQGEDNHQLLAREAPLFKNSRNEATPTGRAYASLTFLIPISGKNAKLFAGQIHTHFYITVSNYDIDKGLYMPSSFLNRYVENNVTRKQAEVLLTAARLTAENLLPLPLPQQLMKDPKTKRSPMRPNRNR